MAVAEAPKVEEAPAPPAAPAAPAAVVEDSSSGKPPASPKKEEKKEEESPKPASPAPATARKGSTASVATTATAVSSASGAPVVPSQAVLDHLGYTAEAFLKIPSYKREKLRKQGEKEVAELVEEAKRKVAEAEAAAAKAKAEAEAAAEAKKRKQEEEEAAAKQKAEQEAAAAAKAKAEEEEKAAAAAQKEKEEAERKAKEEQAAKAAAAAAAEAKPASPTASVKAAAAAAAKERILDEAAAKLILRRPIMHWIYRVRKNRGAFKSHQREQEEMSALDAASIRVAQRSVITIMKAGVTEKSGEALDANLDPLLAQTDAAVAKAAAAARQREVTAVKEAQAAMSPVQAVTNVLEGVTIAAASLFRKEAEEASAAAAAEAERVAAARRAAEEAAAAREAAAAATPIPTTFCLFLDECPGLTPEATVGVTGSFNGWSLTSVPLTYDGSGAFRAVIPLLRGRHQYNYVIDKKRVVVDTAPTGVDAETGAPVNEVEVEGRRARLSPLALGSAPAAGGPASDVSGKVAMVPYSSTSPQLVTSATGLAPESTGFAFAPSAPVASSAVTTTAPGAVVKAINTSMPRAEADIAAAVTSVSGAGGAGTDVIDAAIAAQRALIAGSAPSSAASGRLSIASAPSSAASAAADGASGAAGSAGLGFTFAPTPKPDAALLSPVPSATAPPPPPPPAPKPKPTPDQLVARLAALAAGGDSGDDGIPLEATKRGPLAVEAFKGLLEAKAAMHLPTGLDHLRTVLAAVEAEKSDADRRDGSARGFRATAGFSLRAPSHLPKAPGASAASPFSSELPSIPDFSLIAELDAELEAAYARAAYESGGVHLHDLTSLAVNAALASEAAVACGPDGLRTEAGEIVAELQAAEGHEGAASVALMSASGRKSSSAAPPPPPPPPPSGGSPFKKLSTSGHLPPLVEAPSAASKAKYGWSEDSWSPVPGQEDADRRPDDDEDGGSGAHQAQQPMLMGLSLKGGRAPPPPPPPPATGAKVAPPPPPPPPPGAATIKPPAAATSAPAVASVVSYEPLTPERRQQLAMTLELVRSDALAAAAHVNPDAAAAVERTKLALHVAREAVTALCTPETAATIARLKADLEREKGIAIGQLQAARAARKRAAQEASASRLVSLQKELEARVALSPFTTASAVVQLPSATAPGETISATIAVPYEVQQAFAALSSTQAELEAAVTSAVTSAPSGLQADVAAVEDEVARLQSAQEVMTSANAQLMSATQSLGLGATATAAAKTGIPSSLGPDKASLALLANLNRRLLAAKAAAVLAAPAEQCGNVQRLLKDLLALCDSADETAKAAASAASLGAPSGSLPPAAVLDGGLSLLTSSLRSELTAFSECLNGVKTDAAGRAELLKAELVKAKAAEEAERRRELQAKADIAAAEAVKKASSAAALLDRTVSFKTSVDSLAADAASDLDRARQALGGRKARRQQLMDAAGTDFSTLSADVVSAASAAAVTGLLPPSSVGASSGRHGLELVPSSSAASGANNNAMDGTLRGLMETIAPSSSDVSAFSSVKEQADLMAAETARLRAALQAKAAAEAELDRLKSDAAKARLLQLQKARQEAEALAAAQAEAEAEEQAILEQAAAAAAAAVVAVRARASSPALTLRRTAASPQQQQLQPQQQLEADEEVDVDELAQSSYANGPLAIADRPASPSSSQRLLQPQPQAPPQQQPHSGSTRLILSFAGGVATTTMEAPAPAAPAPAPAAGGAQLSVTSYSDPAASLSGALVLRSTTAGGSAGFSSPQPQQPSDRHALGDARPKVQLARFLGGMRSGGASSSGASAGSSATVSTASARPSFASLNPRDRASGISSGSSSGSGSSIAAAGSASMYVKASSPAIRQQRPTVSTAASVSSPSSVSVGSNPAAITTGSSVGPFSPSAAPAPSSSSVMIVTSVAGGSGGSNNNSTPFSAALSAPLSPAVPAIQVSVGGGNAAPAGGSIARSAAAAAAARGRPYIAAMPDVTSSRGADVIGSSSGNNQGRLALLDSTAAAPAPSAPAAVAEPVSAPAAAKPRAPPPPPRPADYAKKQAAAAVAAAAAAAPPPLPVFRPPSAPAPAPAAADEEDEEQASSEADTGHSDKENQPQGEEEEEHVVDEKPAAAAAAVVAPAPAPAPVVLAEAPAPAPVAAAPSAATLAEEERQRIAKLTSELVAEQLASLRAEQAQAQQLAAFRQHQLAQKQNAASEEVLKGLQAQLAAERQRAAALEQELLHRRMISAVAGGASASVALAAVAAAAAASSSVVGDAATSAADASSGIAAGDGSSAGGAGGMEWGGEPLDPEDAEMQAAASRLGSALAAGTSGASNSGLRRATSAMMVTSAAAAALRTPVRGVNGSLDHAFADVTGSALSPGKHAMKRPGPDGFDLDTYAAGVNDDLHAAETASVADLQPQEKRRRDDVTPESTPARPGYGGGGVTAQSVFSPHSPSSSNADVSGAADAAIPHEPTPFDRPGGPSAAGSSSSAVAAGGSPLLAHSRSGRSVAKTPAQTAANVAPPVSPPAQTLVSPFAAAATAAKMQQQQQQQQELESAQQQAEQQSSQLSSPSLAEEARQASMLIANALIKAALAGNNANAAAARDSQGGTTVYSRADTLSSGQSPNAHAAYIASGSSSSSRDSRGISTADVMIGSPSGAQLASAQLRSTPVGSSSFPLLPGSPGGTSYYGGTMGRTGASSMTTTAAGFASAAAASTAEVDAMIEAELAQIQQARGSLTLRAPTSVAVSSGSTAVHSASFLQQLGQQRILQQQQPQYYQQQVQPEQVVMYSHPAYAGQQQQHTNQQQLSPTQQYQMQHFQSQQQQVTSPTAGLGGRLASAAAASAAWIRSLRPGLHGSPMTSAGGAASGSALYDDASVAYTQQAAAHAAAATALPIAAKRRASPRPGSVAASANTTAAAATTFMAPTQSWRRKHQAAPRGGMTSLTSNRELHALDVNGSERLVTVQQMLTSPTAAAHPAVTSATAASLLGSLAPDGIDVHKRGSAPRAPRAQERAVREAALAMSAADRAKARKFASAAAVVPAAASGPASPPVTASLLRAAAAPPPPPQLPSPRSVMQQNQQQQQQPFGFQPQQQQSAFQAQLAQAQAQQAMAANAAAAALLTTYGPSPRFTVQHRRPQISFSTVGAPLQ